MLVALLLTLSITMNVLALGMIYRLWLWVRLSALLGEPFALFGSTLGMSQAITILKGGTHVA